MTSSPYCALSAVCSGFLFWYINDVTKCIISQLHTWRNFKVSYIKHHYGCEALCFFLSHITWWNNFVAAKIKEKFGKKNVKCLKDKVGGSWRKTSIRISSSETHKHWGTETAQYGLEIIFKTESNICTWLCDWRIISWKLRSLNGFELVTYIG